MGSTQRRFPLSFAQQRLWLLDQLAPGSPYYNIPTTFRMEGRLSVPALEASLTEIARRHETLRTTCGDEGGVPYQEITPAAPWRPPRVDLDALAPTDRDLELRRLCEGEGLRGFDLERGPLARATLVRVSPELHVLLLNIHHVVSDGWSHGVLRHELVGLYAAAVESRPSPLPELPIQYVDFAVWQRQWLQGEELEEKLAYWRQALAGMPPVLALPIDRPRPNVQGHRGRVLPFELSAPVARALRALAKARRTTLFVPLLGALAVVLQRVCNQSDVPLGIPIANRDRVEIEGLIGFFVNTLVVRCDLAGDPTFSELVERLAEVTLGAYSHPDVPFEKLVQELLGDRDLSFTPLFQVMVGLRDEIGEPMEAGGVTFVHAEMDVDVAKFDLSFDVEEREHGIRIVAAYSALLFDDTTLQRLAGQIRRLFEGVASDPDRRLSELSLLGRGEAHQMLVEWNDSQVDFPEATLHELFEEQAARVPEAIALVHPEGHLSYRELDRRSNQVARYLRDLGVGPDVRSGICSDGSPQIMAGMLGVLKAGGGYVPLDPTYPPDRLAFMIEDAGLTVLLTRSALVEHLPEHDARVVCLDREQSRVAALPAERIESGATPASLAYVIFTSGSTGRPKGVLVVHRGVVNVARAFERTFPLGSDSRILQYASFSYDVSASDIFQTLLCGAKLVLQPPERLLPGPDLARLIAEEAITTATFTPSALTACEGLPMPVLGTIITGGEACPTRVSEVWAPGRKMLNGYGPTETTICSSMIELSACGEKPTIGRPLDNTELYVLDPALRPVPVGVSGELYIGGVGVNRGYLERPSLTARRFVPDPFGRHRGARLYRSGDQVRYLADGRLDFLGRFDFQVKVRGFRIELGEIEAKLRQHAAVVEAAVAVKEAAEGDLRLVAYVQLHEGEAATGSELKEFLSSRVPEFMVPPVFLFLDEMPLSGAGKIHRQKLPEPEWGRSQVSQSYVAPSTPEERQLARICGEVLGVEELGLEDDLFEAGLHSLLAMQLIARIRQEMSVELPLRRLFQVPTVAGLLTLVAQLGEGASGSSISRVARESDVVGSVLVEFRSTGSRPPMFCIHPADGEVHHFGELADLLGDDQPFFGLQTPDPLDHPEGFANLDEMIEVYTRALRRVQGSGPYALAGYSLGGVVAFQMARRLIETDGVSLLAVFDPTQPEDCERLDDEARVLALYATQLGIQAGQDFAVPAEELEMLPPEQHLEYLLMKAQIEGVVSPDQEPEEMTRVYGAFRDNLRLISDCSIVPPYAEVATFVLPEIGAPGRAEGWRPAFSGPYELLTVPGDHYSFLTSPHVQKLAAGLRRSLDAAFARARQPAAVD